MQIFGLFLTSVIAVSGSASAAVRVNGFSDYCSSYSLEQKGNVLQVSGQCSPAPKGAQKMGPPLFTSHINIDECLYNDNGNLVPKAHCNCDVGFTLCDKCNGTSLQCSCLSHGSKDRKTTLMDLNEFLGIGLDEQGRVVLYCYGVYGKWNQCVKNGAQTQCPSVLR